MLFGLVYRSSPFWKCCSPHTPSSASHSFLSRRPQWLPPAVTYWKLMCGRVALASSPGSGLDVLLSKPERVVKEVSLAAGTVVRISAAAGMCDKESSQSVGFLLGGCLWSVAVRATPLVRSVTCPLLGWASSVPGCQSSRNTIWLIEGRNSFQNTLYLLGSFHTLAKPAIISSPSFY